MSYSPTDLAYAAGIIDGEGCIGVYSNKNKAVTFGKTFRLSLQVGMCDREPVKFLYETFGGSFKSYKGRSSGYRTRYNWQLGNQKAVILLKALYPYLKGKQKQADVGIAFQAHKRPNGGIVTPLTGAEYLKQKEFSDLLKELKKEIK